ncbi:MAG: ATP-dependent Clp protease, protease subunit [Frankiales bacterium]|jgi:ATP-dependent Clp endopeptidase proteolytic subunit ClpP|nr:ATP-dependent Clp protease, protease subunit [Frankiales bacterium]
MASRRTTETAAAVTVPRQRRAPHRATQLGPDQLMAPELLVPPLEALLPGADEDVVRAWTERYRDRLSLIRAAAETRKAITDAAKADVELGEARRRDQDARAEAGRTLVYTFYAEVGEDSVRTAMQTLAAWSRRDPGAPITIVLNSPGGRVLDGLALYDFLLRLRRDGHHLRIEVVGRAASMGGILLQAGDERIIGPNAFLLIHEVSGGAEGRSSELGDRVEFYGLMEKRLLAILAERSSMTDRQIRTRWQRKDWWLSADEAVSLGFADSTT